MNLGANLNKILKNVIYKAVKSGVPRGIQTPDLQDRNLLLYSAELWAQKFKNANYSTNLSNFARDLQKIRFLRVRFAGNVDSREAIQKNLCYNFAFKFSQKKDRQCLNTHFS